MENLESWLFVVRDDHGNVNVDVLNEALAAAPEGVLEDSGELLPRRRPETATCRICGADDDLSREHIPPRSVGNDGRGLTHGLKDWLERDSLDDIGGGKFIQNGTFGFVLCRTCNSLTGREYAPEYARWARTSAQMLMEWAPDVSAVDERTKLPFLHVKFEQRPFGRFARQVLSMMVSLAGPWDVTVTHPQIREALLDGTPAELPEGMELYMALAMPVAARWCGPSLTIDRATDTWRWVTTLAFPPFAFELTLARSEQQVNEAHPFCNISGFFNHQKDARADITVEVPVTFAHTIFPTDWRSRGQLDADLDMYGRPYR